MSTAHAERSNGDVSITGKVGPEDQHLLPSARGFAKTLFEQNVKLEALLKEERQRSAEKDRRLDSMNQRLERLEVAIKQHSEDANLERQKSADLLVAKASLEAEVVDLKTQLLEELAGRKKVQYGILERERLLHEKDEQLGRLWVELDLERASTRALKEELEKKSSAGTDHPHVLTHDTYAIKSHPGFVFRSLSGALPPGPSTAATAGPCATVVVAPRAAGRAVVQMPLGKQSAETSTASQFSSSAASTSREGWLSTRSSPEVPLRSPTVRNRTSPHRGMVWS